MTIDKETLVTILKVYVPVSFRFIENKPTKTANERKDTVWARLLCNFILDIITLNLVLRLLITVNFDAESLFQCTTRISIYKERRLRFNKDKINYW